MKQANGKSSGISWSMPMDLLETIPLPDQDFRYSGSYEQVIRLFPQLAKGFSEVVYGRLQIDEKGISLT